MRFCICFGVLVSLHIFLSSLLVRLLFICGNLAPMFIYSIIRRNFPNTKIRLLQKVCLVRFC